MAEHLLICNFDFPPNQGIGGRRWAKFAKQLARMGYIIHVIKADEVKQNSPSAWTVDVQHENIFTYSLPRTYPEVVSHTGKDVISKLRYQLAIKKLERTEKGTIYDVSIGWEKHFSAKASELILQFNIKNVIATGAPWNLLVYAARLKDKFPHLNLMVDYRDPWITARNYGMAQLNEQRRNAEKEKQEFVWSKANVVTCPNEFLLEEIKSSGHTNGNKSPAFNVLGHSYDEDDIGETSSLKAKDNSKIVFVYGGALYVEMEKYFDNWIQWLRKLRNENPSLYARLEFRIFTDNQKEAEQLREFEIIHTEPGIGKRIYAELRKADFCIILLSHHNKNFRTTKFYEFLPFRKPFVYIGEKGEVALQIQQEKLGYVIDVFAKDFLQLIEDYDSDKVRFNSSFHIEEYSLPVITRQLIGLLK